MVSNIFYFHPYLGKIPILTNIFQLGWNHQLDDNPSLCKKDQIDGHGNDKRHYEWRFFLFFFSRPNFQVRRPCWFRRSQSCLRSWWNCEKNSHMLRRAKKKLCRLHRCFWATKRSIIPNNSVEVMFTNFHTTLQFTLFSHWYRYIYIYQI